MRLDNIMSCAEKNKINEEREIKIEILAAVIIAD